ncbi:hypothetical protein D9M68_927780 [compost metagenome]
MLVSGISTPNSSPPRRSKASLSRRKIARMRSPNARRQASPMLWPCSSLTRLKKSISISSSDNSPPWRWALAHIAGNRLLNW